MTEFWKMVPNHTFIIGIYHCHMNSFTYLNISLCCVEFIAEIPKIILEIHRNTYDD